MMYAIGSQTGMEQVDEGFALSAVLGHQVDHGIDYPVQQFFLVADVVELASAFAAFEFVDLAVEVEDEELADGGQEVVS